mmetsp:Transcript_9378/g.19681  ORF Transcript_9378/g.19681 Transcript_9378/m.19681 type:complete len:374 (+) Transcript_9378:215-1336(+)
MRLFIADCTGRISSQPAETQRRSETAGDPERPLRCDHFCGGGTAAHTLFGVDPDPAALRQRRRRRRRRCCRVCRQRQSPQDRPNRLSRIDLYRSVSGPGLRGGALGRRSLRHPQITRNLLSYSPGRRILGAGWEGQPPPFGFEPLHSVGNGNDRKQRKRRRPRNLLHPVPRVAKRKGGQLLPLRYLPAVLCLPRPPLRCLWSVHRRKLPVLEAGWQEQHQHRRKHPVLFRSACYGGMELLHFLFGLCLRLFDALRIEIRPPDQSLDHYVDLVLLLREPTAGRCALALLALDEDSKESPPPVVSVLLTGNGQITKNPSRCNTLQHNAAQHNTIHSYRIFVGSRGGRDSPTRSSAGNGDERLRTDPYSLGKTAQC